MSWDVLINTAQSKQIAWNDFPNYAPPGHYPVLPVCWGHHNVLLWTCPILWTKRFRQACFVPTVILKRAESLSLSWKYPCSGMMSPKTCSVGVTSSLWRSKDSNELRYVSLFKSAALWYIEGTNLSTLGIYHSGMWIQTAEWSGSYNLGPH